MLLPGHAPTLRENDDAWLTHTVSRDEVNLLTVLYGSYGRVYSISMRKRPSVLVLSLLLLAVQVYPAIRSRGERLGSSG